MSNPTTIGIARLANQYKDSVNLKAFLEAFLVEFNVLEISGLQLLNERYLDTAVGVQLDGVGEIVGLSRPVSSTDVVGAFGFLNDPTALGFSDLNNILLGGNFFSYGSTEQPIGDDLYRILLRAKIIENQTAMTVDDTTRLISFTFGGIDVHYILTTNLKPRYDIGKILTAFEANLLNDFPILIGIDSVEYHMLHETLPFGFDDDDDAFGFSDIAEPSTNLVGYWPLNDGLGLVAQDVSGNGNDGVLEGGASWAINPSTNSPWIEVDGVDGRVDVGNAATLGANSFSISFVMSASSIVGVFPRVFSKYQDADNSFSLYYDTTNLLLGFQEEVAATSNGATFSGVDPYDGALNSILFVWDKAVDLAKLYFNGVFLNSIDISTWNNDISNTGRFAWGANHVGGSAYKGFLDYCRIYDGVLTADDALILHNYPTGTLGGHLSAIVT